MSREKIREYALATGHDEPLYDLPADEVVAPPTFAACISVGRSQALFTDTELGAHWNLVHGSQQFTFSRPVRAGDLLECTPVIADIVDRERMELLTLETQCVDARTGEPVLIGRSTIIFFKSGGDS